MALPMKNLLYPSDKQLEKAKTEKEKRELKQWYENLRQYDAEIKKSEDGDSYMSSTASQLGSWVARQRSHAKLFLVGKGYQGTFDQEKFNALKSIGAEFVVDPKKWWEEHGHKLPPSAKNAFVGLNKERAAAAAPSAVAYPAAAAANKIRSISTDDDSTDDEGEDKNGVAKTKSNSRSIHKRIKTEQNIKTEPEEAQEQSDDNNSVVMVVPDKQTIKELLMSDFESKPDSTIKALSEIGNLCSGENAEENSKEAFQYGAVQFIVKAMNKFKHVPKVQGTGCNALAIIVSNQDKSEEMVLLLGGVELALSAMRLYPVDLEVQRAGCLLLGNVANSPGASASIAAHEHGIGQLIHAMTVFRQNAELQQYACLALMNMASLNNEDHTRKILQADGIAVLGTALKNHGENNLLKQYARDAIIDLMDHYK